MVKNVGSETILSLANVLQGNQISKETIAQALMLICNGFFFDCGLLYVTDSNEDLSLLAQYGLDAASAQEKLALELLMKQDLASLTGDNMTVMERNPHNTPLELRLLDIYNAQALVIVSATDENGYRYGKAVLLNITRKNEFSQLDFNLVSIALSLLTRCTEIKMYQRKIVQTQATLESVLDNAGVDIYVNDFHNHDILYTNASMSAPYGGKAQFIGKKCWQVLFPGQNGPCEFCPQKKLIDDSGTPTKVYSWDYQRAFDGSWFRVFSAAFHWVDGRLAHVVSSANITENKHNESLIENLANYDQLTQLPNRRSLIRDCERRIVKATDKEQGYLLFFDIDGFKRINDSYGHDAGDEFLIQLSKFFSEIPLLKNSIYRNGGDEFVAILGGEAITKEPIKHLSNFIHERFKKPWKLKNGDAFCNTSIGVACYPEDGITSQILLQKADEAMYRVKKEGGGGLHFFR